MSNKKWLEIDFWNKIKLNIFSHTEENLFIDLLVKQDEEAREKTWEVLWNLNIIKNYIDIDLDDLEKILKVRDWDYSKKVSFELSDKEKRDYMEQKFDFIEKKWEWNIDLEYIREWFPNMENIDKKTNLKSLYFNGTKNWKIEKNIDINIRQILNNYNKDYYLIFPIIFPNLKWKDIKWDIKLIKINKKFYIELKDLGILTPREREIIKMKYGLYWWDIYSQIEIWKKLGITTEIIEKIETKIFEKIKDAELDKSNLEIKKIFWIFDKFIIIEEKEENLANYLLPKTNLFCDYRWINKEMFN